MKELQTADEFFAPQQSVQQNSNNPAKSTSNPTEPTQNIAQPNSLNNDTGLPTADEFFKPQKPSIAVDPNPVSSPAIDEFFQKKPVGRIMSAFGSAFVEGGQGGALGIEPGGDVENALKKYGIFNDYSKGQSDIGKAFSEALIRPAAVVLDNEFRGAQAAMGAVGAGIEQTATEIENTARYKAADVLLQKATHGYVGIQGGLSSAAEYFMTTPAGMEVHAIPPDILHARSVGAIGESESSYFGLKEPTQEEALARRHAADMIPAETLPEAPKDIHAIAREVAPETFEKYDALNTQQDTIRTQIADLAAKRDEEMGINPPHADELQDVSDKIDTILGKVNNVESRLTKKQAANLEDLRTQFDDLSEKSSIAAGADTSEMADLRSQIQRLDYAKRDIAPDVAAAYREAQNRIPEEKATEEAQPTEEREPTISEEPAVEPAKPIEGQLQSIKDDVSKKLTDVGRPTEESQAASELIAQHYKAIADQGWAKGTPEEIYQRDAANIVAGKERIRRGAIEFNQKARGKIRLATDDAKAAITLFKSADASTFIHETGHHWLDEMMRYAKEDDAPATLLKDRETVNQWLGVKDGEEIARAQHEKFARGFERYLMEGTAPSKELANVFAKFKQWLTDIYQTVQRLKSPITDDIRDVFDRLLSANPEKTVITPEREPLTEANDNVPKTSQVKPVEKLPEKSSQLPGEKVEAPTKEAQLPSELPNSAKKIPTPRPAKAPASLLEWISKNGGIKDTGGDLKAMGANDWHKKTKMRKLIQETGMHADDAALKAWQEGYFPEAKEGERPTIQDLHNKIDVELKGQKQYPNNFIKEMAEDPEYVAHIAEQMSEEESQKLNLEIAEYKDSLYKELERQEEEAHGDAWESPVEKDNSVTLEDLENERRTEENATATQSRTSDNARSESSAEVAGNGDQGIPSGGSITETTGRTAGETGEPKVTPEEQRNIADNAGAENNTSASGSVNPKEQNGYFIDKEGKLNKDALNYSLYNNTPDWMQNYFNEYTERNRTNFNNEASEVETLSSMQELVKASGWTPEEIRNMEIGQKQNRLQQLASADLFKQMVEDTKVKAAEAASSGDPKKIAEFFEATQEHSLLMQAFRDQKAYAAEASRNLGIRRAIKSITGDAEQFADLFQKITDIDPKDVQKQADFLQKLNLPGAAEKFLKDGAQTPWERFKSQMLEYYINALISGPITHLRYSVGNALNALWTPLVEVPTAAGIGALREALTGEKITDRVYLGEAGAQLHGLIQGSKNGLRAAADAWNTGVSPALPGEKVSSMFDIKKNAIPGDIGKIINLPGKSVSAIHSFFKALRYEQNIQGMAYRAAMQEGLAEGSEAFTNRVADLGVNPTKEMMESATKDALKELYMTPTDYNSFAGKLASAVNSNFAAKIIVPFMKIGSQITRNAFVERTPLGLLTEGARENALYKAGGVAGDTQLAKMATGVALMGGMSALVLEGLATGDGPSDPAKRAIWMLDHTPNSLQVGGITLRYQGLGSLGMLMRFSANMTETASGWNEEEGTKLAKSFMEGLTKSVLDENFMRGLKDLLDAVYHPDEYGANYIKQFATNWLPFSVGMGQVARIVDPSQREAHTIMEAAMNKIPFVSEGLEPKRNRFGEIMPNGIDERYAADPVVQRLENLQIGIGKIDKKINGVQLTPQQYDDYSKLAGQQTKMRLNQYVAIPQTRDLPPEIQIKTIHSMIDSSRAQARQIVMMNNPDIYKQAAQNKINALTGKK